MLKQSFRMKKVLAIFLAVLFVVSLTSAAVSAENGNNKEIAMKKVGAMKTEYWNKILYCVFESLFNQQITHISNNQPKIRVYRIKYF